MSNSDDPSDVSFGDGDDDPPSNTPNGKLTPEARTLFEDDKAVLFVDLLGFSRLTLKWPVVRDDFWLMDRPNGEDFLRVRLEAAGNNRLIETYMHFNMTIDDAIEQARHEVPPRAGDTLGIVIYRTPPARRPRPVRADGDRTRTS